MNLIESKFTNECQIGMKWRIKEEDLRNLLDGCLDSNTFEATFPGVTYLLKIYPNGRDENERNQVKVFLHLLYETAKCINATFTISVKSASNKQNFVNIIYEEKGVTGRGRKLCTRDEMLNPEMKYFIDGIIEIELEGTISPRGIKRKASDSLSLVNILWENNDDKDLTIIASDGQKLKIHKWVLCAKSDVFKTEMESGLKESQENIINITDFTFETVQIFVEYCYERDISGLINEQNGYELIHFTDKYNINPMHDLIQTQLIDKISELNVVQFANMSITSNANNLQEFGICFLAKSANRSIFIKDVAKLNDEIAIKVCRRSLLSTSE